MIDFYGPLPSGEYLLVLIDRYSRFPEVEIVKSTKASVIILKLDRINKYSMASSGTGGGELADSANALRTP